LSSPSFVLALVVLALVLAIRSVLDVDDEAEANVD
jgi:hypothetical protein